MIRKILIGCSVVFLARIYFCLCAATNARRTRHEKPGVLKDLFGIKITVDILAIYEPGREAGKIHEFRIEVYEGGKLERSNVSFLDNEVESISQAITCMISLLNK